MNLNKLNIIWRRASLQNNAILLTNSPQKYIYASKSTEIKNNSSSSNSSSSSENKDNGSSSSSSSSDSDSNVVTKTDTKTINKDAITKLNTLLQQLIQNDEVAKSSKLELARPKNKRVPKEERKSRKIESVEEKLVKAVTDVAKDIGGDTKQTESELLLKLLSPNDSAPSSKNLNELITGMKIDREVKTVEKSRAEQVRNILQNIQGRRNEESSKTQIKFKNIQQPMHQKEMVIKKIDLFGSKPLDIFTNKDLQSSETKTWQTLYERDLKLAVTHPPINYFQQMILWTEQGKLWKFPIDNEQGLEKEQQVSFEEHIFLEEHLEPWCPPRGPIRHYMELVCVGLSKNPYLTVEAKKEHIEWYKNYFEEKKKLLQDIGALPTANADTQKQID